MQCSSLTGLAKRISTVTWEIASPNWHCTHGSLELMCNAQKHGQAMQSAARLFQGLPRGIVRGMFSFYYQRLACSLRSQGLTHSTLNEVNGLCCRC